MPSFHLVCTLPHDLNPLLLAHQRPLLTLLCKAASQTRIPCGQRHLGGQSGCTMGLHTWAQPVGAHCHVHGVSAAGARSSTGECWMEADSRFLFPVPALSTVLRGTCCEALAQAASTGALAVTEHPAAWGIPGGFAQLRAPLYTQAWVGYARPPVQALSTSETLSAALPIASPSRTTGSSTCMTEGSVVPTATVVKAIVPRP